MVRHGKGPRGVRILANPATSLGKVVSKSYYLFPSPLATQLGVSRQMLEKEWIDRAAAIQRTILQLRDSL